MTILTSSPNPSIVGESVTFNATVITLPPGIELPCGSVTFFNGLEIGTVPLSFGQALISETFSVPGNHTISALYGGCSSGFFQSEASLIQTVMY